MKSLRAMSKNQVNATILKRLEEHRLITPEGCWLWTGHCGKGGYGQIGVGSRTDGTKRTAWVHRVSFQLYIGPIPDDLLLDHLCRNRPCFNPLHLQPLTPQENIHRGLTGKIHDGSTHCPNGHPWNTETTYIHPNGRWRRCRACMAADKRNQRLKTKGGIP